MDLSEVIGVINKWKWLVLPVIILVTGYALVTGLRTPKSYTSESEVVVGLSQVATGSSSGISLLSSGDRLGATYGEMLTSEPVLTKALAKANLDWNPNTLSGMVSFNQPKNTTVMQIDVVDSDPNRAILLSNAMANSLVEYIKEVGQSNVDHSKAAVNDELASIESDMNKLSASGVASDDPRFKALIDRRTSVQTKYVSILDQTVNTGDIRVADAASSASSVGTSTAFRVGIGFVISLIFGIVLAFIAEAVVKAMGVSSQKEQEERAGKQEIYKPNQQEG
ncbi:MAG: Wzz/FepE/Etk N-terminal domain-containing protein [Actinobacteria bacterium]|nr:Wzz/FepE/Etk N-terminal domain-containing protein [Actinomycetota bacterium]